MQKNNAAELEELSLIHNIVGTCAMMESLLNDAVKKDVYNEMFIDELAHLQKLVVELTKSALIDPGALNKDEAFFEGELNSTLGKEEEG